MFHQNRIMEKQKYEALKDIKTRLQKGEPTTFAERNILNMENRRKAKAMKTAEQKPFFQRKD